MTCGSLVDRALLLPLARPFPTLAVLLLATLAAAWSWRTVRLEPDISRLLPQDHRQVVVANLLDAQARPSRLLWVLLRGAAAVARIDELAASLRAAPGVAAVAATRAELLEEGTAAPLWLLPDDALRRLVAALSPDGVDEAIAALRHELAEDPLAARELAVHDPLGLRWLWAEHDPARLLGLRSDREHVVSAAGDYALLRVTGTADAYDVEAGLAVLEQVEQVLAGVEHELFGGYAVARADQQRLRADFTRASSVALLLIAGYLCLAMRGLRLPLLVQLPAAVSIVWAVPFGGLWFGPLPAVTVAAVAVLGGLGVDFAIHYAARYREARLSRGHADAVRHVQKHTVPELLIDMATTAVTFVAVGFGQRGGLSTFGWLLAFGLLASVLVTALALPVLLRFVGERRDPERSVVAGLADRWLLASVSRRVAKVLLLVVAVLGGVMARDGVPVTGDADSLRPERDPVAQARAKIEAALGFATVPCVVLWPLSTDPSPLWQALHEARQHGLVRLWTGLGRQDTAAGREAVTAAQRQFAGFAARAEAQFAAAGFAAEQFAPALAATAALLERVPAETRGSEVLLDGVEQRVVTVWPARRVDAAGLQALAAALQRVAGTDAVVHGSPSLGAALAEVLRADLHRAVHWAAVLALVMVTLWLRSLRLGLLALLPSACGLVATLVLLHGTGQSLSMVSFVAIPFVLGIGVDEGVHLVGHFRRARGSTGAAGVSVVRTSIGTALGFGALLAAESPALVQLGGLVAFGSLASMLAGLFVLAPLLARRDGR